MWRDRPVLQREPCVELMGDVVWRLGDRGKGPGCLMSRCPRGVFGASCRNARQVEGWLGGFPDSYAFVDVGQDAWDLGEVELVGLVLGQADENVLELDDAAGDRGGVELVAVRDQVSLLGLGQGAGVQQPVQWGTRSVVEALAPAGLIGAPSDGLAGGGQEVELDVDLLPETAQDLALLAGVVAVVEGVAAHQVVVLRLDGGLVVLPVGA